jgi:hypothetical protein
MARATTTRGRKAAAKHGSADLLDRLKFLQQIQKKDGAIAYENHCYIRNGRIAAFDGTFTVGMPLAEDFRACPHTHDFVAALERCDETASIVADEKRITINSGKSTFRIKCADLESVPGGAYEPDRICAKLTNDVRTGIEVVSRLAKEGDLRLPYATVLLEANIVTGTNGHAAMQFRHGVDLPPNLILPRKFCDMVVRAKPELTGFGYTQDHSVTFWFSDDSFIKTLLPRNGGWPNVENVFRYDVSFRSVPEGFGDGVSKMAGMTKNGFIEFDGNRVLTYGANGDESGAAYQCDGVPSGRIYNGKTLAGLIQLMDNVDMWSYNDRMFFTGFNGNMRGTLMCIKPKG